MEVMESVLGALVLGGFGFLGVLIKRGNDRIGDGDCSLSEAVSELRTGQIGQDVRLGAIEHSVSDLHHRIRTVEKELF